MHLKVKVWASAGKEAVQKVNDDRYVIFVRQPAAAGVANRRVQQLLADDIGVSVRKVRLISGFKRPNKVFEIIEQKEA